MNTYELQDKFGIVSRVLPKRTTVPIINNFRLKEGKLTATNLEATMTTCINTDINALLPAKIAEILPTLSHTETEITATDTKLTIKSGSANFKLSYEDGIDDYPVMDTPGGQVIELDTGTFYELARSVLFAASTDSSRLAFNGVLLDIKNGLLSLTASDTYRLAMASVNVEAADYRALIPAKYLKELLKLKPDKLSIALGKKQIGFTAGDNTLTIRLLDESYPDVSKVVPADHKTSINATMDGLNKPLANMIKRAMLIRDTVQVSVADGELTIAAEGEVGSMKESLPVNQDGEDVSLHLNGKYLQDVMGYEGIEILLNGADGPVIVKRPGYKYTYLVLPIKKM